MNDTERILARSNELLNRVRRQINETPSFLSEYVNNHPTIPTYVPFAPTSISLEDNVQSIQTAGDRPPETDATARPASTNDEEVQKRLREFARRMQMINSRNSNSRVTLPTLPTEHPPEDEHKEPEASKPTEEEEEDQTEKLIQQKPILGDPNVFVNKLTTALRLDDPITTTSNVNPNIDNDVDNVVAQDIAEDGLWVPDLPLCKPSNVLRMEHRLLRIDQSRRMFFGADFAMRVDTPPITQIAPPFPIEPYDHYGRDFISFAPASVWGLEDIDIKREFSIEVEKVDFFIHPLASPEDMQVKRIYQLYEAYVKDQEFSRSRYYKQRIEGLRQELIKVHRLLEENEDDDEGGRDTTTDNLKQQEKRYLEELHDCHRLQDLEENNSRMIQDHLIEAFKDLRETRTSITTLPLMPRWKRRDFSKEEKEAQVKKYEKEINLRVEEEIRLKQLQGVEPEEIDGHKIKKEIEDTAKSLGLRQPGDSLWKPVLDNTADVTPLDECPPQEKERREQISQAQVFLKYYVNRRETYKSSPSKIETDFTANFADNKRWVSNVIPHTITVEIWESGYFKGNRFIASVILPITVGTTPEFKNYDFTSELKTSDNKYIMGVLRARCYIIPEDKGEVFINCPDPQYQKAKRRLASESASFRPDNLIKDRYDPNDFYLAALLSHERSKDANKSSIENVKLDPQIESSKFSSIVPISDTEQIKYHLAKLRQKDEELMQKAKKPEDEDPTADFLERVKQREIVKNTKIVSVVKLEDVVHEAPIPKIEQVVQWVKDLVSLYRPLKPIRSEFIRSPHPQTYTKAYITIKSAFNIPERIITGTGPDSRPATIYASSQSIHANFHCSITLLDSGKEREPRRFTKYGSGTDPTWFHKFDFDLSKDEEQPTKAELAKLEFRIDLYDEITFETKIDEHNIAPHTEQRFIGSTTTSVQALLIRDSISATLPLFTPPFQLAYTRIDPEKRPGIEIFGKIDPSMPENEEDAELDSEETQDVIVHCQIWKDRVRGKIKKYENRRTILMAPRNNGKPILACRMVKKQEPPSELNEREELVRFVSIIPNISDAKLLDTAEGMWYTSQEFLDMRAGDDEEHAILLCNFFKAKGIEKTYVALGYDYMNGKTAFVVTIEASKVTLYDPLSGLSWSSKDKNCLLYSVGMIFDEDNIWANIQPEAAPHKIDWTLGDSGKWLKFWDGQLPAFQSPQEDVLNYDDPGIDLNEGRIQRELENRIKSAVETWREHQRTKWDPLFPGRLRKYKILEQCENLAASRPNSFDIQNLLNDFVRDFPDYRMNGGPFSLPFTSYDDIINEVKIRETWKTEGRDTDLALCVYVKPYPKKFFVVWVFIASLEYITVPNQPL